MAAPRPRTDRPGDRRFAPSRSVSRERFASQATDNVSDEQVRAQLEWSDSGIRRPVKDLGWLQRNSTHVSQLTFDRGSPGRGSSVLRASGQHPIRGRFEYEIPFASRDAMRDWVSTARSRWDHVNIEDKLYDGGA